MLDWSKLKAFADDKINLRKKTKQKKKKNNTYSGKGRKHCGEKEKMLLTSKGSLKVRVVWLKVKSSLSILKIIRNKKKQIMKDEYNTHIMLSYCKDI